MLKKDEVPKKDEVQVIEALVTSYNSIESDATNDHTEESYKGEKLDKINSQKNNTMSFILTKLGEVFKDDIKTERLMSSGFLSALNNVIAYIPHPSF